MNKALNTIVNSVAGMWIGPREALRKLMFALTVYSFGLIIFIAGLTMTLVDLYMVQRQQLGLGLTELSMISLPMTLLPLFVLVVWSLVEWKKSYDRKRQLQWQEAIRGLVFASLGAIIHDFITDLKTKEQSAPTTPPRASTSPRQEGTFVRPWGSESGANGQNVRSSG